VTRFVVFIKSARLRHSLLTHKLKSTHDSNPKSGAAAGFPGNGCFGKSKFLLSLEILNMGRLNFAHTANILNGKLEKSLILWNRTSSRAYEHSAQIGNSVVAETIKDAVSMSDIVWSCLADQDAVFETFEIILKEDIKGKLFVECSTMAIEATNDLARRVVDSGGEFVAMPGKKLPLNI
jgi:hypothetical protein